MDLMTTFASLSGTKAPTDRNLDSLDLTPALLGKGPSPRRRMFYWTRAEGMVGLGSLSDGTFKSEANDVSADTGTFGGDQNTIHLITRSGVEDWPTQSKLAVAQQLSRRIAEHFSIAQQNQKDESA